MAENMAGGILVIEDAAQIARMLGDLLEPDMLAHRLSTISYEGLISKPFALDDILRTVRRYVVPN